MTDRRKLTLPEANKEIAALVSQGVQIFDFRGKSPEEQEVLFAHVQENIARRLNAQGLPEDFPVTFVAGSGKTNDAQILQEAHAMGQAREAIVNGASQYSVMGAVAEGAKVKIGVTCDLVMPFELPDARYDMLLLADGAGFEGLEHRLKLIRNLTRHELAIHGGMGTLEEVIGGLKVREEVSLLLPYWGPMLDTFKKMYEFGFIEKETLDRLHPVSAAGTPVDKLSTQCTPNPAAAQFRETCARVAEEALQSGRMDESRGMVLDGKTPLEGNIEKSDFFLLPPGNIDAMHQALMLLVEKRIDLMPNLNAPHPGIARKPLVILNVDHFYDRFIEQWQEMQKKGFLMEDLKDLFMEVKIDSHGKMISPEPQPVVTSHGADICPMDRYAAAERAARVA